MQRSSITAPACWRVGRRRPQYFRHAHGVVKRSRKFRQCLGNHVVRLRIVELELSECFGESYRIDRWGNCFPLFAFHQPAQELSFCSVIDLFFVILVVVVRDLVGVMWILPRAIVANDVSVPVVCYEACRMVFGGIAAEYLSEMPTVLEYKIATHGAPKTPTAGLNWSWSLQDVFDIKSRSTRLGTKRFDRTVKEFSLDNRIRRPETVALCALNFLDRGFGLGKLGDCFLFSLHRCLRFLFRCFRKLDDLHCR